MTAVRASDPDATRTRRLLLGVDANPDAAHDYVTTLRRDIETDDLGALRLVIRYVPDRDVLASTALDGYLPVLAALPPTSVEHLALTAIEDLNDALIPRWIEVAAEQRLTNGAVHSVSVEDRQPGWDNPRLLARLGPVAME